MPDYGLTFSQNTLTTSFKTAGIIAAAAAAASGIQVKRGKVFDLNVGQGGAPSATDTPIQWDVSRSTTLGTATSVTISPDDPADAAFNGQAASNATVEPTIAAAGSGLNLVNFFLNQRASYRWSAKDGKELIYPATANNGFAVRALATTGSSYTGSAGGSLQVTE
jgi:hypothetical protein